jgi:hypothetical protein
LRLGRQQRLFVLAVRIARSQQACRLADHLLACIPRLPQVAVVHVGDVALRIGDLDAFRALLDGHRQPAQLVGSGLCCAPGSLGVVHQVERGDARALLPLQFGGLVRRQFGFGALCGR